MLDGLQKFLSTRNDQNIIAIILLGSISWILTMVKSGLPYSFGIGYWGPNGHDGIWHIALARSLSQFSLDLPIYAGANIANYHIGFDLVLAFLHRITFLPISVIYFQLLPILISLGLGFLIYKFLYSLNWDRSQIFWSLFFVYFGGNFALRGGESVFWSQQAISTLVNPPFALSLIFIISGLIFLEKYLSIKTTYYLLLSSLFFGLLIQIKAYASVVILGSLLITGTYKLIKKRDFGLLKIFLISSLISAIIFLPFNANANSLFEFRPFWFLETMMHFPDRLGWTRYGEAMVNYKLAGNFVKGIPAYLIAFIIFWYGNMGSRFLAELYIAKFKFKNQKVTEFDLILLLSILIGVAIPMFFVQKGTAWNTIQFFYYSLFFASILAGYVFSDLINSPANKKYKNFFVLGIVFFTAHTSYKTLKNVYLPVRPPAMVSTEEVKALEFLENQEKGVVLTLPFDKSAADEAVDNPPRPLYLYESTAYVSAFTGQQVFLEDEVNLDITGFDWRDRRAKVIEYFNSPNSDFLEKNNIKYVYLAGDRGKDYHKLGLEMIYDSDEVKILIYE